MTTTSWIALGAFGALAAGDWVAVARRAKRAEYVLKPAALVALVVVAVTLDPVLDGRRVAFLVALALSLAGDVFLMLPVNAFLLGLGSFLLAHLAYIVGLRIGAGSAVDLLLPALGIFAVATVIGTRILRAVHVRSPAMTRPVAAYIAVISVMVASALALREPIVAVGALLFYASDALIAWNRFVTPLGWAPVAIMVTYHLGQAGLVLSLARL